MLRDLIHVRNCSGWVQRCTWSSELGRRGRGTVLDIKRQLRGRDEVQSTGHGRWLQRTGHSSGHGTVTAVSFRVLRLPKRGIGFMLPAQMNAKHLPGCSCYICESEYHIASHVKFCIQKTTSRVIGAHRMTEYLHQLHFRQDANVQKLQRIADIKC